MKKFLSAVFVMTMLVITATIAGSVLAAESYVFDPTELGLEDYPVVYFDKDNGTLTSDHGILESTDSTKAFSKMEDAVNAIQFSDAEAGYVILVSDYILNNSKASGNVMGLPVGEQFPTHSKMIILRGMEKEDSTKSKFFLGGMCNARGPLSFQNLEFNTISTSSSDTYLSMQGYEMCWGTPGAGYDDVITKASTGAATGAIIVGGDGGTYDRDPVWNLYSGTFGVQLNLSGAYSMTTINGDVTINNIGCDMSSASIRNGSNTRDTTNGNVNFNITGGKTSDRIILAAGSCSAIMGDINVTISGTPDVSGITEFVIDRTSGSEAKGLVGNATLNVVGYLGSDKDTVTSRLEGSFDTVIKKAVFVSENGDDTAAGTSDAPVKTYEKAVQLLAGQYGAVTVLDTLTISDCTEASRSNLVYIQGVNSDSKVIIDGNFTLGGNTTFSKITVKNGTSGAIIANGKNLTVDKNVKTAAGADGKYIDIIAGRPGEFIVVNVTILAGTYNKIDPSALSDGSVIVIAPEVKTVESGLVEDKIMDAAKLAAGTPTNAVLGTVQMFENVKTAKISPEAGAVAIQYTPGAINAKVYKFVSMEYYVNIKDTDTITVQPQIKIGENIYTAPQTAVNGWNIATFDISAENTFNTFTFYPYGKDVVVESYNKIYPVAAKFSQLKNEAVPTYGDIFISVAGDFIPVLDDYVMGVKELLGTKHIEGLTIAEAPFVIGSATQYTPTTATGVSVDQYIIVDGAKSTLRSDNYPYVRVEYYMYARDTEDFGDVYPTLTIGEKTYVAPQKLTANEWAVATFYIGNDIQEFENFVFKPYGEASGLNEWNKMYIQQIKFVQTENTVTPEYPVPDMSNNGELVPYKYNPGDGKPVVYVTQGGVYDGDVAGSVDSTKAYGSLAKAFAAIDADEDVTEAYVIILNDIDCGLSLPTHTKMITIRGKESEDDTKKKLKFCYMASTNGPIGLENLEIYWQENVGGSNDDTAFVSLEDELVIGKQGVANDVIYTNVYKPADTVLTITGVNVTINSGAFRIRFGNYGNVRTYEEANITLNGGSLDFVRGTHGDNASTTINKDINLTFNGGKVTSGFAGLTHQRGTSSLTVKGNLNILINGGDFSSLSNDRIASKSNNGTFDIKGDAIIDTLNYNGDIGSINAKIKKSDFTILNINSVYLADGGTGNGSSSSSPVGSLADAVAACTYKNGEQLYSGRIIVCGEGYTVSGTEAEGLEHEIALLYTSIGDATLKFESGTFELQGPANFKDITLELLNDEDNAIVANGYAVNFLSGVSTIPYNGRYLDIIGGTKSGTVESVEVVIDSGEFGDVIAGDSVEGDVSITINGGEINGSVIGGTSAENGIIGGNVTVTINGGDINGSVTGGSTADNGMVEGMAVIEINGGTFYSSAIITAANTNETATIAGNAKVEINSGNFDAMDAAQIQAGYGVQVGSKTAVDYQNYDGNVQTLEGKINNDGSAFDVTIGAPAPKPVFSITDKFIFILEVIGSATDLFDDSNAMKITQSVPQSMTPVVVSPKQLNLKVDGSDQAILTLQNLSRTIETIRITPNHNPTNPTQSIAIDGYNISGRGVEVSKHKYVEIVYYYTVPEGEVPAVKTMGMKTFGANTISRNQGVSTPLVANKWATTIMDMSAAFQGNVGELSQYHLYPMGSGKKGTEVPETQCIDILSLTFYSEKPSTTIVGGIIPEIKVKEEKVEETDNDMSSLIPEMGAPEKEIIPEFDSVVVDSSKLIRFTGNVMTFKSSLTEFDGKKVVKIQPVKSDSPLSIDGAAIFEDTKVTPNNALNLLTHRFAVITYYYATEDTESERIPEFDLLGGRIQDQQYVVNNVTAKGKDALKKNQWATVVVKLSGNGDGVLTSGFNLRPFGNIAASELNSQDVLYIENITFVSNRP